MSGFDERFKTLREEYRRASDASLRQLMAIDDLVEVWLGDLESILGGRALNAERSLAAGLREKDARRLAESLWKAADNQREMLAREILAHCSALRDGNVATPAPQSSGEPGAPGAVGGVTVGVASELG